MIFSLLHDIKKPNLVNFFQILLLAILVSSCSSSTEDTNSIEITYTPKVAIFSEIASINTITSGRGLAVYNDYIFVAEETNGVSIVKNLNNSVLIKVGNIPVNFGESAYSVVISNNHLFLAARSGGLKIYDISTPESPIEIQSAAFDTPGKATSLTIENNTLYLSDLDYFFVFDISNPSVPILKEQLKGTTNSFVQSAISSIDNFSYVAGHFGGLVAIDFVNHQTWNKQTGFNAWSVATFNDYILVGGEGGGLNIFDNIASNTSTVSSIPLTDIPSPQAEDELGYQISVLNNHALIADGKNGLQAVNLDNIINPYIAGSFTTGGNSKSIVINDDLVYLLDARTGLQILDMQIFDDTDGDGVHDAVDAFPLDATESVDIDGDGIGNNADPDADNDGILDETDTDDDNDGIPDEFEDDPTAFYKSGWLVRNISKTPFNSETMAVVDNGDVVWLRGKNRIELYKDNSVQEIFHLTPTPQIPDGEVFAPHMHQGQIVWRVYDKNDHQYIYMWDGDKVSIIDDYLNEGDPYVLDPYKGYPPTNHCLDPTINNGRVVYSKWDGQDYELFQWEAGNITQLTDNEDHIHDIEPTIEGDSIAFIQWPVDVNQLPRDYFDIPHYIALLDLNTNTIQQLSEGSTDPHIDGDRVVYSEWNYDIPGRGYEIISWENGVSTNISNMPGNEFEAEVSGDIVTWVAASQTNGSGDIFVMDGDIFTHLEDSPLNAQLTWVSGNQVVYAVNNDGDFYDVFLATKIDTDGDGVNDAADTFPLDAFESIDTDGDGVGNNADTDDDNDSVSDVLDTFPLDASESIDTDGDGVGNNADTDDDNDSVSDAMDTFPLDASESIDTDGDGIGNNADPDDDNDGILDAVDPDDDNDGVSDVDDWFPSDPNFWIDSDGDGIGDNNELLKIDNESIHCEANGTWDTAQTANSLVGSNYLRNTADSSGDFVICKPIVNTPGNYNVYATWPSISNGTNSGSATYRIEISGVTTDIIVDQKVNMKKWNLLGEFYFPKGNDSSISLMDTGNITEYAIADAIMLTSSLKVPVSYTFNNLPTHLGDTSLNPNIDPLLKWDLRRMLLDTVDTDILYGAFGTEDLCSIDVSDPTNLTFIDCYRSADSGQGREVLRKDNYLILTDRDAGLRIFDTTPGNGFFSLVKTIPTFDSATRLSLDGDTLYVGDRTEGMLVYDVIDAANPVYLNRLELGAETRDIKFQGNYAYVANYFLGLAVVNKADPANPVLLKRFNTPRRSTNGGAWDLEIKGQYIFILQQKYGVQIADISDPNQVDIVSEIEMPDGEDYGPAGIHSDWPPLGIELVNNLLIVSNGAYGVLLFDVTDIRDIKIVDHIDTPGVAGDTKLDGSTLYIADGIGSGLQVYDISDYSHLYQP